jgi:hypothetical protein
MTDRVTRLYTLVVAVLVFVVAWAAIAARPWQTARPDPRLAALAQRERALRVDAKLVGQIVSARAAAYHSAVATRQAQIAAAGSRTPATASSAPAVRVVNLPPLTITKTS